MIAPFLVVERIDFDDSNSALKRDNKVGLPSMSRDSTTRQREDSDCFTRSVVVLLPPLQSTVNRQLLGVGEKELIFRPTWILFASPSRVVRSTLAVQKFRELFSPARIDHRKNFTEVMVLSCDG